MISHSGVVPPARGNKVKRLSSLIESLTDNHSLSSQDHSLSAPKRLNSAAQEEIAAFKAQWLKQVIPRISSTLPTVQGTYLSLECCACTFIFYKLLRYIYMRTRIALFSKLIMQTFLTNTQWKQILLKLLDSPTRVRLLQKQPNCIELIPLLKLILRISTRSFCIALPR